MTNNPTIEEIVNYVATHHQEALNTLTPKERLTGNTTRQQLLISSTVRIMLKATPPPSAVTFAGVDVVANAYTLAREAYDALVRGKFSCSEEPLRIAMVPVGSVESLIVSNVGRLVAELFIQAGSRREIIAPVCGAEYSIFQQDLAQKSFRRMIDALLPRPYIVEDIGIFLDSDSLARQYLGWQRPVGEVRVVFGVGCND